MKELSEFQQQFAKQLSHLPLSQTTSIEEGEPLVVRTKTEGH